MLYAYQGSAILMGSHELGIYGVLSDGPLNEQEIAAAIGSAPRSTALLLNACVAMGLLHKAGDRYSNSSLAAEFLAPGKPGYLGRVVSKEQEFYQPWGRISQAVREDKAQLPPMTARLDENPETARNFLLALHDLGLLNAATLPDYVDLPGPKKLLDVGGGVGTFSILLAESNPELRAVVLDLPQVQAIAEDMIASHDLSDRIEFRAGDYSAPSLGEGYDAVLLSNILHDNTEEACRELIAKSRRALVDDGLLVINEFFLDQDGSSPPVGAIFSLLMMLENQGAAEYPVDTIKGWLLEAGFVDPVTCEIPDPSPMVVVVARKG
jgi:predicted O-methyltransferase YrrM